jgi:hypothetical protein
MNHLELVREAHRLAHHIKAEGDLTFEDLFPDDTSPDDVAQLYSVADEWRKTAELVSKLVAAHLEPILVGKSLEVGGILFWRGESRREVCVDADGFWRWVDTLESSEIRKLFNENTARKGALPPAARETFYEKQSHGEVKLQSAPIEVIEQARQKRAANE